MGVGLEVAAAAADVPAPSVFIRDSDMAVCCSLSVSSSTDSIDRSSCSGSISSSARETIEIKFLCLGVVDSDDRAGVLERSEYSVVMTKDELSLLLHSLRPKVYQS